MKLRYYFLIGKMTILRADVSYFLCGDVCTQAKARFKRRTVAYRCIMGRLKIILIYLLGSAHDKNAV